MLPPMCRAEGVIWWFQIYWTPSNAIATIQIDKIELISALLVYFLTYFFEDNLPTPSALAYPPPSLPRCCVFFNDSNYPGCFIPLGIHKHYRGKNSWVLLTEALSCASWSGCCVDAWRSCCTSFFGFRSRRARGFHPPGHHGSFGISALL